jgi:hypothetical protein
MTVDEVDESIKQAIHELGTAIVLLAQTTTPVMLRQAIITKCSRADELCNYIIDTEREKV